MKILFKTKLKNLQNMDSASNLLETITKNFANWKLQDGKYMLKM